MTDFDVVVGHGAGIGGDPRWWCGRHQIGTTDPRTRPPGSLNAAVATGRSTLRTSAPVGAGTSGFSRAFSDTALIEAKIVEEKARNTKQFQRFSD
jgi:hypothetical protein